MPDVFCVNKSDLGAAANRTTSELETALSLIDRGPDAWAPPVLQVSARDNRGIDELVDAMAAHHAHALASGELARRRAEGRVAHVALSLMRRYGSFGLERLGGEEGVRAILDEEPETTAFRQVEALAARVEDALRKGD